MDEFCEPCIITLPCENAKIFSGVFLEHAKLFKILEQAIIKNDLGDHHPLWELGNPTLITNYMAVITEKDESVEREEQLMQMTDPPTPNSALARFFSVSPLFFLIAAFADLINTGLALEATFSPSKSVASAQAIGFFSSPGGFQHVSSLKGTSFEVPANMKVSDVDKFWCLPEFSKVSANDPNSQVDPHVGAELQCSPDTAGWIIALGVINLLYFLQFFAYRLRLTWRYKVNDLRFIIATDRANTLHLNFIFCCTGACLAITTLLTIWYYRAIQSAGITDYLPDVVNMCVIIYSIHNYSHGRYDHSKAHAAVAGREALNGYARGPGQDIMAAGMPAECIFTLPPTKVGFFSGYGALISHDAIFSIVERAFAKSSRGDDRQLAMLCGRGESREAYHYNANTFKTYMEMLLRTVHHTMPYKVAEMTRVGKFIENPLATNDAYHVSRLSRGERSTSEYRPSWREYHPREARLYPGDGRSSATFY
jgi:hypothetical protein